MKLKFLVFLSFFIIFVPQTFAAKPTPTPTPPPVTTKSVCIDPGHGGIDTGATYKDITEAALDLDVAEKLKTLLISNGYSVFMTRENDVTLSNSDRYTYCNSRNANILVSVHHNGSTDPSVDYSTALYMKKADVALAEKVVSSVSSNLHITNNGISRFASGVLLKAEMPAAISEGFFITNENEYNFIKTTNRLDQEASALLMAVQSYFGN